MAVETQLANAAGGTVTSAPHGLWAGSLKPFLVAHPIGVAVVGGALVGVAVYYLMNKYSKKAEEPSPA